MERLSDQENEELICISELIDEIKQNAKIGNELKERLKIKVSDLAMAITEHPFSSEEIDRLCGRHCRYVLNVPAVGAMFSWSARCWQTKEGKK